METKNVSVINPDVCSTSLDFKAEFEEYLGEAESLSDAEIQCCRVDTDVVAKNVQRGVLAVMEASIAERIRRELPALVLEPIYDLPRLAGTVAHAARLVSQVHVQGADIQKTIARGFVIRRRLLTQIDLLVETGAIQPHELDTLRKGRGAVHMANDLVDGAAILARVESDTGPSILLQANLLDEARQVAQLIFDHVTPSVVPKPGALARADAAAVRDRLWTLLVRRHRDLRRIAWWLWGEEAALHVPLLGSRRLASRRRARATPAPAVNPADRSGDKLAPQTQKQGEKVPPAAA